MADQEQSARVFWSRLGGKLGVGLCGLGFLLVFLGWSGAASVDRIPSQFPYLISGGIAGLCFVLVGVGMLVVQNQRADRAALQASLRDLQTSLERAGIANGADAKREAFAKPAPRRAPRKAAPAKARAATAAPADQIDATKEIAVPKPAAATKKAAGAKAPNARKALRARKAKSG